MNESSISDKLFSYITNETWQSIFDAYFGNIDLNAHFELNSYVEQICCQYKFNPLTDNVMSFNSNIFELDKAAAMFFWYQKGDRKDYSIISKFDEYKHCIDEHHPEFNSNYGYYAYEENGISLCIQRLLDDPWTRQACFCINNREAMSDTSIDKLCTNAIQFVIRNNKLYEIVQMRSSNFFSLLPYDAFMFSVFYADVFSGLRHKYDLKVGEIVMQVSSLHFYLNDVLRLVSTTNDDICKLEDCNLIGDFAHNYMWKYKLSTKLKKAL